MIKLLTLILFLKFDLKTNIVTTILHETSSENITCDVLQTK